MDYLHTRKGVATQGLVQVLVSPSVPESVLLLRTRQIQCTGELRDSLAGGTTRLPTHLPTGSNTLRYVVPVLHAASRSLHSKFQIEIHTS